MKFKHRMGWPNGKIDIGGKKYNIVNGVFEIPEPNPQVIQRLKAAGHKAISQIEEPEPEVVEAKPWELTVDELTEVNGVGKAYATKIIEAFPLSSDLVAAGASGIAEAVGGISELKAQEIIDHILA